ncbi:MAG: hypothetical protein HQL91_09080 [Magnetococcales bacterium]|nr:hypothetical protein [Magnetococcales bacterium]
MGLSWRRWMFFFCMFLLVFPALAGDKRVWKPLDKDGLHDPQGPSIRELQNPADALSILPPDLIGNMVRWVGALDQGFIQPRANLQPGTKVTVLDMDLIFGKTGDQPYVRFPHKAHTEWLDCANCHEGIFKTKFNASGITMAQILEGRFCGVCHGAVAFPLTECTRCHSVTPDSFKGAFGAQNQTPAGK